MKQKKSKAQLRVEIAKDVLKHIKAEKIVTEKLVYFEASSDSSHCGEQLKDVLPKLNDCRVCALGGMFYAHVNRNNKYQINTDYRNDIVKVHSDDMRNELSMFSNTQLWKIEISFECDDSYRREHDLIEDEDALIHIMKNIIKNKGTFKPKTK